MKKLLVFLIFAAITVSGYSQLTTIGLGTPANPYKMKYKVAARDTIIPSPVNTAVLTKDYTFIWQIHWQGLTAADSKIIPLQAAAKGDSLWCYMIVDTTKCLLLNSVASYGSTLFKNIIFEGYYSPSAQYAFLYRHGTVTGGWIWIYQIFKSK